MGNRQDSDEAYVLDLCDDALGEQGSRQHRFDWLLGDPGVSGRRARLPVDSYWASHRLVVEYREIQHDQPVPFFDKPDRLTVSGVHRGEQRALYDARRDTEVSAHGLRLVVIRPSQLDADSRGRLRRNRETDLETIRSLLAPAADDEPRPSAPKASDEERVVEAFRRWLTADGWTPVTPTDPHTDIEAVRGEERLIGEAKGRTKEPGTDADTAYGQLLRRMTDESPTTRYALIVSTTSAWHAQRVPAAVRRLLRIDLYEVTESGAVKRIDG
ncbi:hypothetical protein ACLIYP_01980 [Streptomyces nanhaiensis]|uniref:hypothetical protein n=1 Tax=Streptomyces nanhaiensis TaxID=679319 RepID=UPI00399D205D